MRNSKIIVLCFVFVVRLKISKCQVDLHEVFGGCKLNSPTFDDCVKDGVNNMRSYFSHGLPEYGVDPFDPFHAAEVPQRRKGPFFDYKLVLRNVTEAGWSQSTVTKFRSDIPGNKILVTQFFPHKTLDGQYEIDGSFFGQKVHNTGSWNLSLFDYTQTLTISRLDVRDLKGNVVKRPPLKVKCNIQSCKNLKLHIGNLAGGRTIFENMLDWVINTAWQPGFVVLSPMINDLVGTAFTEIFNKDFQYFPFESIFTKS